MQRQVRFNRVPEKAPEKNPEKVLGGFGAESGQVQQGSGDKACEALVQSQVRLNRAPEKVREKFPGSLGAKPSQAPRVPEKVRRRSRRRFWESLVQGQVRFNRFSRGFPALGFAARFGEICI